MKRVITRTDFVALAGELGVRRDWHEPDEQEVTVEVDGSSFDNAGTWPRERLSDPTADYCETHVIFRKDGQDVAAVNLATLCAWASGLEE